MNKSNKFSPEVRERAVRMVQEHRGAYPSLWAAVASIAPKIGCVPQTLLDWGKRAEVDAGARPGATTAEMQCSARKGVKSSKVSYVGKAKTGLALAEALYGFAAQTHRQTYFREPSYPVHL